MTNFLILQLNIQVHFIITIHQYQTVKDFNTAISLKPDYANAYNNRANVYIKQNNKELGCNDARKACALGECKLLELAKGQGYCR